ncbi:Fic family protein [Massilia pseudoviolaceinigra]|uniref:Fic family protein n=1 Tax=Massilia pseudoviolaceinigra TaxID=3057165 RepID=UPI002796D094|nr:Fic family protein [Massilia sp. CCM 9206]MDQ1919325.1 Fic family protein [Massilia sp. CCM 9206]
MSAADNDREKLETSFTTRRATELELSPVRGQFDVGHLKEINRRLFQDLPKAGFDDVKPGEFRPPAPEGKDWVKNRGLATVAGSFYVAYSSMNTNDHERLDKVLEGAVPDKLRGLKTEEFTATIGRLYAELDYVHPFSDGNSRTLRTFTKQLATEAGYDLDWSRFNKSDAGRDVLYIARDRSVNELAKPYIKDDDTMRKVVSTLDRIEGNPDLPALLRDAVRPTRAVEFDRSTRADEAEVLKKHPELKEAFRTVRSAADYFEAKIPGDAKGQQEALQQVRKQVVDRLNKGETSGFGASPDQPQKSGAAPAKTVSQPQKAEAAPVKTVEAKRPGREVDRN